MTIRETVLAAVARVCAEKGQAVPVLSERDRLGEGGLGLDSLDMATIVADLELSLHQDPFAAATPVFRTLGELVALYDPGDSR